MHKIPLRFVWRKVHGMGARSPNANLNLTAYIDFLLVTVIFLLTTFNASGQISVPKEITLPTAENAEDVIDAPIVSLDGNQVFVDGQYAGSAKSVEDRLGRIDELFAALKTRRENWKTLQPNKPFPGVVILQIDQETKAVVVKSVFQTAAYAGYPNVSFMVTKGK
ncbi:MAG: biopolymer transporter ExbD [Polyangiaceae bacterium]|nr:biopolymer transporter ExbD [Polyangiaceae bacterium]